MEGLASILAAAVGAFAGTNVDDLVMLTLLFLAAGSGAGPDRWRIWAGQYLGMAALVAVSGLAALGLAAVPERWVGLLGMVPLGLGVYRLAALLRARRRAAADPSPKLASGALAVAALTMANGGDNVAAYTPLFRALGVAGTALTVATFGVLVAVWCVAASLLSGHRRVLEATRRLGPWLIPAVYITIGTLLLVRTAHWPQ